MCHTENLYKQDVYIVLLDKMIIIEQVNVREQDLLLGKIKELHVIATRVTYILRRSIIYIEKICMFE